MMTQLPRFTQTKLQQKKLLASQTVMYRSGALTIPWLTSLDCDLYLFLATRTSLSFLFKAEIYATYIAGSIQLHLCNI
jgi:hypothetical protein